MNVEKKEYSYQIDGKTYILRPLVIGQIAQMMEMCKNIKIPSTTDVMGVARLFGEKLPEALAIMLTEEGTKVKDKNLPELTETLRDSMNIELVLEVVGRFIDLNPIGSIFERLTKVTAKIGPLKTTES